MLRNRNLEKSRWSASLKLRVSQKKNYIPTYLQVAVNQGIVVNRLVVDVSQYNADDR